MLLRHFLVFKPPLTAQRRKIEFRNELTELTEELENKCVNTQRYGHCRHFYLRIVAYLLISAGLSLVRADCSLSHAVPAH